MFPNLEFSQAIASNWKELSKLYGLTPTEFLAFHGVVIACMNQSDRGLVLTVTIADVINCAGLQRETARRAMMALEGYGLIKRTNGNRWVLTDLGQI